MKQAEELKVVAERWMEEIWRKRDLTKFDEIHSLNFMDKSSAGRATTREAFKKGIIELYEAFPDWEAIIDDLVVDPTTNKVAVRWTATGAHRAAFMGIAPTNKRITFNGIEIVRVEGGQIVERWGEWNGIELLRQLGAF
ncbi:MAG: ester cyclase [Blastocatellia bacterium]